MSDMENAVDKIKNMLSSEDGQSQLQSIISMFAGQQGLPGGNTDSPTGESDSDFYTDNASDNYSGNEGNSNSENHFGGSSSGENSNPFAGFGGEGFNPFENMDMIMKIMNAYSKISSDGNSHAQLLNSIKPYIKSKRRDKIDSALKMMNLTKIASVFKEMQ